MISKKKIFAIVVFIIFGLFMFSFANPAEIDNNQPVIGEVEVNKAKLKDAINRGMVIIKNRGTGSDLLKELDNAIKDGQIVFDGETTQKEVDDATKRIEDAIKAIEDDIMNRAKITLVPNTTEKAEFVNLITTVTIDDNKFIDNVKLVNGTNCNANGINLALVNNQAIIRIEENGVYTSCLFLTNGTIKKDTKNISNISKDIEAPKITLNGKDVLKVVLGKTTYTDELAKVTDNVDLENQIKGMLDGSIDKVGAYMLKYNAKDKAGNIAKEVVRTIKVLDPKADEDKDGFTNEEEVDAKTDFDDKNSHPDTVAPIITLKGKNPYVILTTQKYVEPGYGITLDPHDTITKIDNVIISGTITEGTVGRYALNYSITDSYGKSANISRTIVILTPNGDEDKDGYTNKEELDDSKNPLDNKDYPSYDKRPTINLDEKNIYNMIVYDELPTFSATATDVADGKVNVIITHNIDKNQNGIYKVIFKAIDCLENERIIEKEFKVNKRSLIVAIDNKTSIYNASLENLTFIVTKGINVVGNEANIVLTKAIGSNVGKYAITGTSNNTNYDVTFVNGTYEITAKKLEEKDLALVTFTDKTFSYDGTEKTNTVDKLPAWATVTYDDNTRTDVGTQQVIATIKGNANYTGTVTKQAKLVIEKALVTVTIDNKASIFGSEIVPLTSKITGTVYGKDNLNIVLTKAIGSNVGKYTITGTSNNTNYDVTFVNGTYEITKVPTIVPPISGLVAVKGDLISSVILPKGFSYIDSSIVLNNAGNYTTDVIYTPEDTVNYDAVKVTVTIYVKDIFTVEFKDGNIVLNTVSVIEGMDAVAPMNPIKNGYTFNGWDISFKNVTKNLIINTLWKIENYSITYIGIEGTLNVENNPLSYTINSATFTLDNPVKNNYTFIGWTDENSLNPTKNMTVVTGSFGNKTYTANFEANVTGIVVNRLQPLKFAVGSSPIIEDYIEVYELRANGTKGRKLNRNEWSANVNTSYLVKNKPLTVTRISNNVTDSTLTYDVLTNDEYLQLTKFQITFNSNKQYTKCISYAWKKTYSEQYDRDLYLCNGTEVKTAKYNFFEITEHYLQNITNIQVTAYYSDDLGNVFGESLIEEDSHYSTGQVNNIKYGPKYRVHFKNKDVITDDSLKYVEIQYRRSGKGTFKIIFDYDMTLNKFTARIEYQLVNENWVPYNQG